MDQSLTALPFPTLVGSASSPEPTGPVLIFGNVPFASPWQRAQQLSLCLAEQADVVYVDPNRSLAQRLRRRSYAPLSPVELPPRLLQFRPPAGLPFARSVPLFHRLNCARSLAALDRLLTTLALAPPAALVLTYPDQLEVVRAYPDVPVVYDLMDEPLLFLRPWQVPRYRRLHEELLERCDLLVTSSHVLHERYRGRARRAICITNGVRRELLDDLLDAGPHPLLKDLPRPLLGYVGMISHWMDFAAIAALAEAYPTGSVVLVGPRDVRTPRLPGNVHFLGEVPHRELASVLRGFDLGLIPFRPSSAIDAVNPIKLYEYLAAGLPVLASSFDEIQAFTELVAFYRTVEECVAQAGSLLARPPTPDEVEARRAFAGRHCWTAKAAQLLTALKSMTSPALAACLAAICAAA